MGAIELDDLEAVFRANFVFHAIQVILDRLFGEGKVIGNFFIGKSLRYEWN